MKSSKKINTRTIGSVLLVMVLLTLSIGATTSAMADTTDTVAPVITILGSNPVTVAVGSTYIDAGATAMDAVDGDVTSSIEVHSTVSTAVVGRYKVDYYAYDNAGNEAQETRDVYVVDANQVITFSALPDRTTIDGMFAVSATASSGLPVSFAASGQCMISGVNVTTIGAGSCTITASQAGNEIYAPAQDISQTFNISKYTISIFWLNPSDITYGTPLSSTQLNAIDEYQDGIDGQFIYTPAAGTVLDVGTHDLNVVFVPDDQVTYGNSSASVTINVIAKRPGSHKK